MGGFLLGTDPTLRTTKTPTVDTFAAGVGFTAGSSTTVTLSADPGSEKHLTVFFDGVGQHRSTYSVSGTTVTFDTAIPTGTAEVEATFAIPVSSVTVSDDSVTLAKMASGTDGNIISYDASGNPVAIATGTSGHFLKSQGAGAQPVFAADNKGSMTFINTSDISDAATYDFTGFTAASYDTYVFHIMNLIPATDDVALELLTSTDGGSSYDTGASDYGWFAQFLDANTGDESDDSILMSGSTAHVEYRFGSAANEDGVSMVLYAEGAHLTKRTQFHWIGSGFNASGKIKLFLGAGARLESADVDGIRLLFASGNIESGTITAYGLANA